MDRYQVRMTGHAIEQVRETVRYISFTLQAPDTALQWAARLEAAMASLDHMPARFPRTPEEPWHTEGIHRMPVENFLVYYWINEGRQTVWITAVLYVRRDQLPLLREMPPRHEEEP